MPARKTNRLSGRCPLALLFATCVTGHLALLKREVLDHALPFPKRIRAHDHWIPFVAAALNGIKPTDHILSLYRVHEHNVSIKSRNRKRKGPLARARERKIAFNTKWKYRMDFLQYAKQTGLLTSEEQHIAEQLETALEKHPKSIVNRSVRSTLLDHSGQLLSLYKKKSKIVKRLSHGGVYFSLTLYQKKP